MLFIKHFFIFLLVLLVFGSMALPIQDIIPGKFYMGLQEGLHPPIDVVCILSVFCKVSTKMPILVDSNLIIQLESDV